ncbi:heavy-metal-associated domain-containing protein [Hydrogenoanaerobacterium saccharovorans]|uniref:Heavy-metal-associated domain-containing protein n=1 Tax=Hydrogenoanaerobacterium saccharovorans TaxID=474960 RepID=A0A1H8CV39_9FIRM|nr:cation transporter [Hydrogenoanaerobacterium saccharovorans]RPF43341.1 heavy-metal-associated domain-containing protein [Hydrogenoanaerobacterium saccharovorans]SEM99091.1 Heavy-metal-associated domain-containing protein [Hydrogenoanaerobacterium saccharovorans]
MIENAYFIVEDTRGNHNMQDIKTKLDNLHGISSVYVDNNTHLVAVDYNSSGVSYDNIEYCLNKMGYQIAADASYIHTR